MEIHSSATSIQLSGTHTFDGNIDYNLIVPVQRNHVPAIKQQIKEIEIDEEALGGLNLYLKLAGNVQAYNLRYDHTLFKEHLRANLKKQGDILGELLQGKAIKKPAKELSKEDYFDFD